MHGLFKSIRSGRYGWQSIVHFPSGAMGIFLIASR